MEKLKSLIDAHKDCNQHLFVYSTNLCRLNTNNLYYHIVDALGILQNFILIGASRGMQRKFWQEE